MTGGDRLSYALTPRRLPGGGHHPDRRTRLSQHRRWQKSRCADLGPGAHSARLPQETILFDRSALARTTEVHLAAGASCLLLEAVVLGRAAMGETVRNLTFRDTRRVLRGGVPLAGRALAPDRCRAGGGPWRPARHPGLASLALVAEGAEARLPALRAVLDEPGVSAGASGFDGKLTLRLMAADGWPLRRQILRVLGVLRDDPAPRLADVRTCDEPDPREREKLLVTARWLPGGRLRRASS